MVVNKRSKNRRYRGHTTHGYGSMKKNRGAGHRGGRGKAGSGKRGDAKKPSFWKNKKFFGKFGFKTKDSIQEVTSINIKMIEDNLDSWLDKGLLTEEKGSYVIDLIALGYDKLLSAGKISKKYNITIKEASVKAQEKIQAAGGTVVVTEVKKEVKESKDEKIKSKSEKK